ncbi:MAG: prepilin peptidase [Eubacterium sp.]|nr:prepilin peptidase [Eubacterium sp.]
MEHELVWLVLLPASLFDLSRYRIPNPLLVTGLVISLFRHLELQGIAGMLSWLAGGIVPFILVYFFYRLRMFGASDGKLAAVIGSYVGLPGILSVLIYSIFAGAVLSLIKIVINHTARETFFRIVSIISDVSHSKKISRIKYVNTDNTVIPYGVALSFGTLFYGLINGGF